MPTIFSYMGIGQNIKKLRKEAGLTQVQLAEILGTSQQVITSYERELNKPDPDKLPEIAEALEVPVDALFDPTAKHIKKSAKNAARKGSRLSKVQELFLKLKPNEQRLILNQIQAWTKG